MSTKEKEAFGKRLKEMVGGQNQKHLSKKWQIAQSMVSACLNGEKMPSLPKAIIIAQQENVCVEWLLTGRGPVTPQEAARKLSKDELKLLQYWKFMDARKRKVWLASGYEYVSEEFDGEIIRPSNNKVKI